MTVSLRHLLGWIVSAFSSREDLILENLALRQQLLTLHATRPRRRLTALHKLFWVALRRFWSGWTKPLVLVTPRTVVSWHRGKLPATLRRSLTWDRGLEMANHKDFTIATDVKVYFCDPQSPWQRGTNENTNLLLRQYFPRGTDLSAHSQAQLDQVSLRLNQRPRKTLGFETPASKLQASVASTA